jgi:hypothetical protein
MRDKIVEVNKLLSFDYYIFLENEYRLCIWRQF